jgi:hypothetical protein
LVYSSYLGMFVFILEAEKHRGVGIVYLPRMYTSDGIMFYGEYARGLADLVLAEWACYYPID